MGITLIIITSEYPCRRCGQLIHPGEKAVKYKSAKSLCNATEIYSFFYHEGCWKPRRKKLIQEEFPIILI